MKWEQQFKFINSARLKVMYTSHAPNMRVFGASACICLWLQYLYSLSHLCEYLCSYVSAASFVYFNPQANRTSCQFLFSIIHRLFIGVEGKTTEKCFAIYAFIIFNFEWVAVMALAVIVLVIVKIPTTYIELYNLYIDDRHFGNFIWQKQKMFDSIQYTY